MRKKELPSLPLFTDKFIAETTHLDNIEVGIYIRLMCWYWTKKRALTEEEAMRIASENNTKNKQVKFVLKEFFKFVDGVYKHKRLEQEHEYLKDYYENKSISGRVGGLRSKQTVSKTKAPISISIPNSISNKKYTIEFETFWKDIIIKKGTKFTAFKAFNNSVSQDLDVQVLVKTYNSQVSKIKDEQYVPYVSTWLNKRSFEIVEEEQRFKKPTIEDIYPKGLPKGCKQGGSEGEWNEWYKDGQKFYVHKFRNNIQVEQNGKRTEYKTNLNT